ncbi:MAG: anti-sigma factor [Actinomycetota bacterium]|nr:anti-sigma factor [Actinomycetota bacterium]
MSGRRHQPWRARFDDLKEAYALGALSADERREFEGYLAAHPELQAEADDLGSIAGLLALAPQEYEPSPELRHNVFAGIEASGGVFPRDSLRRSNPRLRGLFGSGGLAAAAVAAVAVLALVGLFAWNSSLRDANEDLRGELENRQTYQLQGSGPAEDVQGEVVTVGEGRGVLVAENLPPTPEGEVYQAWLLRDDVPEPAGVFDRGDGDDTAAPIAGSLEGADAVAVTVEPSGGSPAPTSDILMTATL